MHRLIFRDGKNKQEVRKDNTAPVSLWLDENVIVNKPQAP